MTKIVHTITIAAVALLLAGCAGVPVATVSDDANYLSALRISAPTLTDIADEKLIDSGRGVCNALGDGHTARELSTRAVRGGLTLNEGDSIIHTAINVYCPTHVWHMEL